MASQLQATPEDGGVGGHLETGELLTRLEAADLAGVHYNTIRTWEGSGLLHPVKLSTTPNGEVLIRRIELMEAIRQRGPRTRRRSGAGAATLTAENEDLRQHVNDLTRRAEVAEALAAERAARIADLQRTIRLLEGLGIVKDSE
jgi:predicted site-specific integrase-resolvase